MQLTLFSAKKQLPEHAEGCGVQVRLEALELVGRASLAHAGWPVIPTNNWPWIGSVTACFAGPEPDSAVFRRSDLLYSCSSFGWLSRSSEISTSPPR
jgi:hypothetical protein